MNGGPRYFFTPFLIVFSPIYTTLIKIKKFHNKVTLDEQTKKVL